MALTRGFNYRQFVAIDPLRTKLQFTLLDKGGDSIHNGRDLPPANLRNIFESLSFGEKL